MSRVKGSIRRDGGSDALKYDPYSYAMIRIVPTLRRAIERGDNMSRDELDILMDIKKIIETNDPESLKLTGNVLHVPYKDRSKTERKPAKAKEQGRNEPTTDF